MVNMFFFKLSFFIYNGGHIRSAYDYIPLVICGNRRGDKGGKRRVMISIYWSQIGSPVFTQMPRIKIIFCKGINNSIKRTDGNIEILGCAGKGITANVSTLQQDAIKVVLEKETGIVIIRAGTGCQAADNDISPSVINVEILTKVRS